MTKIIALNFGKISIIWIWFNFIVLILYLHDKEYEKVCFCCSKVLNCINIIGFKITLETPKTRIKTTRNNTFQKILKLKGKDINGFQNNLKFSLNYKKSIYIKHILEK